MPPTGREADSHRSADSGLRRSVVTARSEPGDDEPVNLAGRRLSRFLLVLAVVLGVVAVLATVALINLPPAKPDDFTDGSGMAWMSYLGTAILCGSLSLAFLAHGIYYGRRASGQAAGDPPG